MCAFIFRLLIITAGGVNTCFNYNPFAWWDNDRATLMADEDVGKTLGQQEAPGGIASLLIRRLEVYGGITEDAAANDGSVAQVEALMLWVFVDVAAAKLASPIYNESVLAWEQAALVVAADANSNPEIPLKVSFKIDSSIQAEIEKAVDGDMPPVYASFAVMFTLLLMSLVAMDKPRWVLAVCSTSILGFTVVAQLGFYGWLVYVRQLPPPPPLRGVFLVFFLFKKKLSRQRGQIPYNMYLELQDDSEHPPVVAAL